MIVQRYLIINPDSNVFSTNWFDAENHYEFGSTVINLATGLYTINGKDWYEVEEDHL